MQRTAPTTATVCTVSAPTVTCNDTGLTGSTSYSYTVQSLLGTNWDSGHERRGLGHHVGAADPQGRPRRAGTKTAGTAFNVTLTATTNGTTTNTSYTASKIDHVLRAGQLAVGLGAQLPRHRDLRQRGGHRGRSP